MKRASTAIMLLLSVAGCEREATSSAPPEIATIEETASTSLESSRALPQPQGEIPRLTLGSDPAPDGSMLAADRKNSFRRGETIYAAIDVDDLAAGTEMEIVWLDAKGSRRHAETIRLVGGEPYLSVEAPAQDWPTGSYRVQVLADGKTLAAMELRIRG
jgi:hypothetical protein